jgi:hypothetical protein
MKIIAQRGRTGSRSSGSINGAITVQDDIKATVSLSVDGKVLEAVGWSIPPRVSLAVDGNEFFFIEDPNGYKMSDPHDRGRFYVKMTNVNRMDFPWMLSARGQNRVEFSCTFRRYGDLTVAQIDLPQIAKLKVVQ